MSETALPLDYREQPNPPPRPSANDERCWIEAVKASMKEIVAWGEGEIEADDETAEMIVEACLHGWNGYERAKYLDDRYSWRSIDEQLVEILGGIDTHREHKAAEAEWIAANGITPKIAVGTRVVSRGEPGTVTAVIEKTGHYIVQTDKWLQDHRGQPPTCGYLEPYERVQTI